MNQSSFKVSQSLKMIDFIDRRKNSNWSDEEIDFMISIYATEEKQSLLKRGSRSNLMVYQQIADFMDHRGMHRSAHEVKMKLKNLKYSYRKLWDNYASSGFFPERMPLWFDKLDRLWRTRQFSEGVPLLEDMLPKGENQEPPNRDVEFNPPPRDGCQEEMNVEVDDDSGSGSGFVNMHDSVFVKFEPFDDDVNEAQQDVVYVPEGFSLKLLPSMPHFDILEEPYFNTQPVDVVPVLAPSLAVECLSASTPAPIPAAQLLVASPNPVVGAEDVGSKRKRSDESDFDHKRLRRSQDIEERRLAFEERKFTLEMQDRKEQREHERGQMKMLLDLAVDKITGSCECGVPGRRRVRPEPSSCQPVQSSALAGTPDPTHVAPTVHPIPSTSCSSGDSTSSPTSSELWSGEKVTDNLASNSKKMHISSVDAVIFAAGRGTRMPDVTNSITKSLLPIGNYPMIYYSIQMLQKAQFTSAIIVVPALSLPDIQRTLTEQLKINLKYELFPISDEDYGTADTLRLLVSNNKIQKNDVLFLSVDFISDFDLTKLVDFHRSKKSSFTSLFCDSFVEGTTVPGRKLKIKKEKDLVGYDPKNDQLVFFGAFNDFERGVVSLHLNLLIKHPEIKLSPKLNDCHAYIVRKETALQLAEDINTRNMATIKGEVLPYFVRKQMLPEHEDPLCFALLIEVGKDCTFATRCNQLSSFFEVNKLMSKHLSMLKQNVTDIDLATVSPTAQITKPSQVGNDCIIGQASVISEKCNIKRSVVGSHCNIGKSCKIVNSLLMDHCKIQDGVNISNSIICHNVTVGEKCELKDCIVISNTNVELNDKRVNDVIGDQSSTLLDF